jgi:hypothetical protein
MKKQHQTDTSHALKEAIHLQDMESNPLDQEQIAMFEMFEREGWSDEQCRAYIQQRILQNVGVPAAE